MQRFHVHHDHKRRTAGGWILAVVALPAVSLLAAPTGCGPAGGPTGPPPLQFQAVDGAFRYSQDRAEVGLGLQDSAGRRVVLRCARNEARGFFLQVRAAERSFGQLTLQAGTGADGAPAEGLLLDVYRVWMVETGLPSGWHIKAVPPELRAAEVADVLVPLKAPRFGQPFSLSVGEALVFWVDVTVPQQARPGAHTLNIEVHDGQQPLGSLPVEVEVLPFALPQTNDVALLGSVNLQKLLGHHLTVGGQPFAPAHLLSSGPLYQESVSLVQRTLLMLLQHGLNPVLSGCYPVWKEARENEMIVKWQDYDAVAGPVLDALLYPDQPRPALWPVPFDGTFPSPPPYDPLTSPSYARTLRQYLAACAEHFSTRKWLDRSFVMLPVTLAEGGNSFQRCRSYAEIARRAGDRLHVACRLPPQDLRPYGWTGYRHLDLAEHVDIWCPPAQFFDPAVFARPPYRHHRRWLLVDRPPFSGSIDQMAGETFARVIPWQAKLLGAEALVLPEINRWPEPQPGSSRPPLKLSDRDTPLLVPGSFCGVDLPLPTIRLKMLRRGMTDLAYLQLAQDQGLHDVSNTVLRSLCRHAGADAYGAHLGEGRFDGWVRDALWFNTGRELLTAALLKSGNSRRAQLTWQRFLEGTQRVDLAHAGTRVTLQSSADDPGAQVFGIEMHLDVRNHATRPVSGTLSFGDLPIGWSVRTGRRSFQDLAPGATFTTTLAAQSTSISPAEDGKIPVPVVMAVEERSEQTTVVEVAHVAVRRLARPLALGGDLTNWPPALGNTVNNFSSISGPPPATVQRIDLDDTMGFVYADQAHVYFLFHCLTPGGPVRRAASSNFLTYQDRIPMGEELLEILIDPGNTRSTSPEHLFHLAIKPSGAVFKERGIRAEPQIAAAGPWAADVQAVCRIKDDKWIAEVRIPLESFGPAATKRRSWGVNFCRFNARRWTYSNWASARWNVYNPMSLGNMSFAD